MTAMKGRAASVGTSPSGRRWLPLYIACGAATLVLAGCLGWLVHSHTTTRYDVTVVGTLTGKIDILNTDQNSGCVQGTGQRVCSTFLVPAGTTLHVGETVHVAHEVYKDSNGNGYDMLVVIPSTAP